MTYCCSVFPKIAKRLQWIDCGNQVSHPYLHGNSGIYAEIVNFCPSCGADIRGIVISKDEFDKLK